MTITLSIADICQISLVVISLIHLIRDIKRDGNDRDSE